MRSEAGFSPENLGWRAEVRTRMAHYPGHLCLVLALARALYVVQTAAFGDRPK